MGRRTLAPLFPGALLLVSLAMPGLAVADVGGSTPDAGRRSQVGGNTARVSDATTQYSVPVVRVIHVHAESPAVQAFYGYLPENGKSTGSVPSTARGDRRFERMTEMKAGADFGVTYVNEAMNSTAVVSVDEAGTLSLSCLHGAVEDVSEHLHTLPVGKANGEGKQAPPSLATKSGE